MVVGTAERHIQIYNLTNPGAPYKVSGDVKDLSLPYLPIQ